MGDGEERRSRALTPADVDDIVAAMKNQNMVHECRYDIEPEHMRKMIAFLNDFYDGTRDVKRIIRVVVVTTIITGTIGLIVLGFVSKIRGMIGNGVSP